MKDRQTGRINPRLPTCHRLGQKSRLKNKYAPGGVFFFFFFPSSLLMIGSGFSTLALLTFWGWIILCCESRPVHCRIFSNKLDLHLLDACNTSPQWWQPKMSPDMAKPLLEEETESPLVENHCCRSPSCSHLHGWSWILFLGFWRNPYKENQKAGFIHRWNSQSPIHSQGVLDPGVLSLRPAFLPVRTVMPVNRLQAASPFWTLTVWK